MRRVEALAVQALRDHMATGKPPVVPLAVAPLWQVFAAISPGRVYTEAGPQSLTVREIEDQARLMGFPLALRHVDLIRALDQAWHECVQGVAPQGPLPALTAAAFDAMIG